MRVNGQTALQLLPTATQPSIAIGPAHTIASNATGCSLIGGSGNDIDALTTFGAMLGGQGNFITGASKYPAIVGGSLNTASANYAFVAGGFDNAANGANAAAVGGDNNGAKGNNSIVLGGSHNQATGDFSFAAGYGAQANTPGSFVWSDASVSGSPPLQTAGANSFNARAVGGFYFYTDNSGHGASLGAGSGTWSNLSDRNAKKAIESVVPEQVLSKLEAMPVTTWQYTSEVSGARHMGPMAQDFRAAYGLGDSDRGITTVDGTGVALAAIQGLAARLRTEQERNDRLEKELRELRALAERGCVGSAAGGRRRNATAR
jgi:hypothetical protein